MNDGPVVVVGAGSTGTSTAYHLAKEKQRVLLIDKGQVASGMTSRSTANIRTHYSNEIVARMALYSLKVLRNFDDVGYSGFVQWGKLFLAGPDMRDAIMANNEMLSKVGVRSELMNPEEASRRFPEIDFEGVNTIVLEPQSGYADPSSVSESYAKKALDLGAGLMFQREVKNIEIGNKFANSLVLTDGTRIHCSKIILCTNVWTNKLLVRSGVKREDLLPLWAAAHPVVVFRRPKSYSGQRVGISDLPNKVYFKPEGKSLFFAGSLDSSLDEHRIDPDECPKSVSFEFLNFFFEVVCNRIPVMREATFQSSYVGMYDMTPDQHPIIDRLSDIGLENVFCCVGLSGHGFKLCPALGLMNAEMVMDKQESDQTFDRSYFSLSRFKTGKASDQQILEDRNRGLERNPAAKIFTNA